MQNKVLLLILDGWGLNKNYPGNAIALANTPNWDKLWAEYPHAKLDASGLAVGLPEGQMGNSEINHAAIGSGRVIYQDLVKITKAAAEGVLTQRPVFQEAFAQVKENDSAFHIMGLLSPGGVHSHEDHIFALMREAAAAGIKKIFVHAFTDGRDVAPKSCMESFEKLDKVCQETGAQLASIAGRFWAMDRDKNWERTDRAFEAITERKGLEFATALGAVEDAYSKGKTDEFIEPVLIKVSDPEAARVSENDAVVFVNFRNDRPRQLTERFLEKGPKNLFFITMTLYSSDYKGAHVAFGPEEVNHTLGQVLSENKIPQMRVTETEKFAHLTFFMNCKREEAWPLEDRFMFDSNKVESHHLMPEMKALEIADKLVELMSEGKYPAIFSNICNGDMVGHSGDIPATIKAVEAVDQALGLVLEAAVANNYDLIVTADHGNCDEMLDDDGNVVTAHSTNLVPFILISKRYSTLNRDSGIMADIAPTILELLDLAQPEEMTGKSFL
jgi:2,3-bisphosphoglycerate-independent phosphoglycerate mutase